MLNIITNSINQIKKLDHIKKKKNGKIHTYQYQVSFYKYTKVMFDYGV